MQIQAIHEILLNFEKRAENKPDDVIAETFVDAAPLVNVVSAPLNQIIFGRRGTGKTHALKYCLTKAKERGEAALYIDIRTIGSNGSFYADDSIPEHERGLRLVTDILQGLHDGLLGICLQRISEGYDGSQITTRLDDFASAVTEVRLVGEAKYTHGSRSENQSAQRLGAGASISPNSVTVNGSGDRSRSASDVEHRTVEIEGRETRALDFGRTQVALSGLIAVLNVKRFWLLLDEWSETPREVQPYLADLIRKTILPIQGIVTKIAAIEQRSEFVRPRENGGYIGLELGADIAADLNLDEFLVFDYDEEKAVSFFRELLYRNFVALGGDTSELPNSRSFINLLFTEKRAFEEFVRAVEGVPRDALNLISKSVMKLFGQKLGVDVVRKAALDWYQSDKVNIVNSTPDLQKALNHIIDEVIGNRRARAFLFPSSTRNRIIDRLYDARIIHMLRKNISSRDEPGKRYDAWKIDYGCYVDLVRTQHAPIGLLPDQEDTFIDVPTDDYRSIRRAVLSPEDLEKFAAA